jgi:hypothetical protein
VAAGAVVESVGAATTSAGGTGDGLAAADRLAAPTTTPSAEDVGHRSFRFQPGPNAGDRARRSCGSTDDAFGSQGVEDEVAA